MQPPKTYYTALELAGLPGMPGTERGVQKFADRESWSHRKRQGRGGGREYCISSLPSLTQDHLSKTAVVITSSPELPVPVCQLPVPEQISTAVALAAPAPLPELTELKKKQVEVMDARMFFLRLIERAEPSHGVMKAIKTVLQALANGEPHLVVMAEKANDRKGQDRELSERTLLRWWSTWLKNGKSPASLAPKHTERLSDKELVAWSRDYVPGSADKAVLPIEIPAWLPYFLDEYRRPSKPSAADSLRKLRLTMPPDIPMPTYDQVKSVIARIPEMYLQKKRYTGAEYKAMLGYAERDASEYVPMTICQIDGHSFKSYVAHPVTGAHFHPEVCGVICLTSKILAGFSAGLAESSRTVSDAYRHACTINEKKPWGGVCAILEADRGAGNMALVNSDEFLGLFARVGTTLIVPEKGGNPQGRGAIERSNQSIWIRAAKDLITYTGKDMDKVTRKRVYERLERDLDRTKKEGKLGKVEKTSELLLSWREFLEALERFALEYNNTPHSSLPKITAPLPTDPQGKPVRRNMTPFECWADYVARGFEPVKPSDTMIDYLFMPHETALVKREKFTLFGNTYHAYELSQWHERQVIVAYDIHDANQVVVLDLEERFICLAKWNGNRVHAHPVSVVDQAVMKRAHRQRVRQEKKLDLITASVKTDINVVPDHIEVSAEVIDFEARLAQKKLELEQSRKFSDSIDDIHDDILRRQEVGQASAYEITWVSDRERSLSGGKRVGLYKEDPDCAGRFASANVSRSEK